MISQQTQDKLVKKYKDSVQELRDLVASLFDHKAEGDDEAYANDHREYQALVSRVEDNQSTVLAADVDRKVLRETEELFWEAQNKYSGLPAPKKAD